MEGIIILIIIEEGIIVIIIAVKVTHHDYSIEHPRCILLAQR